MNDTAPWAAARMNALYRQRSGGERVEMACRMYDTARRLLEAGIRSRTPCIGDRELRLRAFEMMYAGDFEPEQMATALTRLAERK